VQIAGNGIDALELLQRERFDAVLMDLQMPRMDGFEATLALRRMPGLDGLPVIAMTAHAMARDRDRCMAVGMNDFVTKPFEPRELFATLARWLPQATAQTSDVPAVDFALGLERCLGREELYRRILRRFVETRADDAAALQQQLTGSGSAAARALAHTIGADPLAATARDLQIAIEEDDRAHWLPLLDRFIQQHAAVMSALRNRLDGAASPQDP
jgi:CheY-like chemotaxis protein